MTSLQTTPQQTLMQQCNMKLVAITEYNNFSEAQYAIDLHLLAKKTGSYSTAWPFSLNHLMHTVRQQYKLSLDETAAFNMFKFPFLVSAKQPTNN
jgi:hypothetical protein